MSLVHEPLPVQPELIDATRQMVADALEIGGRVRVTVTSKETGKYLSIRLSCKARKPDGKGYISRARKEGRVGISHADVVFADADDLALAGEVGRLYVRSGQWYGADRPEPRAGHYEWAAHQVLSWAAGGFDLPAVADVQMQTECCICGHRLNSPTSIERGIGPECWGKVTGDKHV